MNHFALAALALILSVSAARADSITLNAFNNSTPATVTFNDGQGHNDSIDTLLTRPERTTHAASGNAPIPIGLEGREHPLLAIAGAGCWALWPRGGRARWKRRR